MLIISPETELINKSTRQQVYKEQDSKVSVLHQKIKQTNYRKLNLSISTVKKQGACGAVFIKKIFRSYCKMYRLYSISR